MIIYLALVSWVLLSSISTVNSILKNKYVSSSLLFLFIILLLIVIPFNDFSEGDMPRYISALSVMRDMSFLDSWEYFGWEPLFIFLQWTFAQVSLNENLYIIYTAIIYIIIYYFVSKTLFSSWQRLFFFFAYLSFSSFYSYLFNGTRQGFSMALILLAIGVWSNDKATKKKTKIVACLIGSCLFHTSAIPVSIILLFLMISKVTLNKLLVIWVFFSVLFLTGANTFISSIPVLNNIEYLTTYSDDGLIDYYGGSNKLDFYVFSLLALIGSLFLYFKVPLEEAKKIIYLNLLKSYIVINTLFLAFGFIAFSNRLAIFSWILIPLLIIYPILYSKVNARFLLFATVLALTIIGFFTSAYEVFNVYPL